MQNLSEEELQAKLERLEKLEAKEAKQLEYQKRLSAKNSIIMNKAKKMGITATRDEIEAHLAS
jgi:hypothetical protein